MKKKKAPGPVLVVFGLFFCGMAGFGIVHMGRDAYRQAHLVAVARTIPATVVSADIVQVPGKTKSRFKPLITYRYEVDGKQFQSDHVFPVATTSAFSDRGAVEQLIQPFPVGGSIIAFHDPHNPQDSFLIRQIDFEPYSVILFVMLHFSVGLMMLVFNIRRSLTALGDVRRCGIVLGVWTLVGALALTHYLAVGGELDAFSGGFGGGFIVITLLLAWWWSRVSAKVVNSAQVTLGDSASRSE